MRFLRVILFIAIGFEFGCGKEAPPSSLNENAAKSKEEAMKNAQQQADEMKTKMEKMGKGGFPGKP